MLVGHCKRKGSRNDVVPIVVHHDLSEEEEYEETIINRCAET
jgi:hypothetical protein